MIEKDSHVDYLTMVCYYLTIYSALEDEATAFDNKSSSTIKLNNGTVLYLREVNRCLALVCILREESFDKQGGLNMPSRHNSI